MEFRSKFAISLEIFIEFNLLLINWADNKIERQQFLCVSVNYSKTRSRTDSRFEFQHSEIAIFSSLIYSNGQILSSTYRK